MVGYFAYECIRISKYRHFERIFDSSLYIIPYYFYIETYFQRQCLKFLLFLIFQLALIFLPQKRFPRCCRTKFTSYWNKPRINDLLVKPLIPKTLNNVIGQKKLAIQSQHCKTMILLLAGPNPRKDLDQDTQLAINLRVCHSVQTINAEIQLHLSVWHDLWFHTLSIFVLKVVMSLECLRQMRLQT